jgi:hypothetical protein
VVYVNDVEWEAAAEVDRRTFTCGYCDTVVGADRGYYAAKANFHLYLCPNCQQPTFFDGARQTPSPSFGRPVAFLPDIVAALYDEARRCMSASAYTAAVLACRKLLMNMAVQQNAQPNQSFTSYVEFLKNHGWVPPNASGWVELIRTRGNEATHEVRLMERSEAEQLLSFLELLLTFMYELPARAPDEARQGGDT